MMRRFLLALALVATTGIAQRPSGHWVFEKSRVKGETLKAVRGSRDGKSHRTSEPPEPPDSLRADKAAPTSSTDDKDPPARGGPSESSSCSIRPAAICPGGENSPPSRSV